MGGLFSRILPRGCQSPVDEAQVAVAEEPNEQGQQSSGQRSAGGNRAGNQSHLATIYEDGHRQSQEGHGKSAKQRTQATSWPSEEQAIAGQQQQTPHIPGYQSIGGAAQGANGGQSNMGYVTTPDMENRGPQDKIPAMVAQQSLGLDRSQFSQQALINQEFLQRKRSREEQKLPAFSPTSVTAPAPPLASPHHSLPGAPPLPNSPVTAPIVPTSSSSPFPHGEPLSAPPIAPKPMTKPLTEYEWHETTTTTDRKIVDEPATSPDGPDHVKSVTYLCESMRAMIDSKAERPLMTDFSSVFKKEVEEGRAPSKEEATTVGDATSPASDTTTDSSPDRTKTESSISVPETRSPLSETAVEKPTGAEANSPKTQTSAAILAPDAPIIPPPYLFCDYRDDAKHAKTSASITLKTPEREESGLTPASSQGPATPAPTPATPSPVDLTPQEEVLPSPEIKSAVTIATQSSVIESKGDEREAIAIADQVVQSVIEEATQRLSEPGKAGTQSLGADLNESAHSDQQQRDRSPRAVSEPPRQIPQITETRASIPAIDEEEAAIRIQAAFRGYRVRKGQSTQEYEDMVDKEPAIVYYRESTDEIKDIEQDPAISKQDEQLAEVQTTTDAKDMENMTIPVEYASIESPVPLTAEAVRLSPTPERQLGPDEAVVELNSLEALDNKMNGEALHPQEAATRIQAAFRGFQVRKSMSRDPSPNQVDRRPLEDDTIPACQAQLSQAPPTSESVADGQSDLRLHNPTDQQLEAEAIQTLDQLEEHLVEQLQNQNIDDQDIEILEMISEMQANRLEQAQPSESQTLSSSTAMPDEQSQMQRHESVESDVVVIGQEATPSNEPPPQPEQADLPTETIATPPPQMTSSIIESAVDPSSQQQPNVNQSDWFGDRPKMVEEGFGQISANVPLIEGSSIAPPEVPERPLTPHEPSDAHIHQVTPVLNERAEVLEELLTVTLRASVAEHKEQPKPIAEVFEDDVRGPLLPPEQQQESQPEPENIEPASPSKEKKTKKSRSKKSKGPRPDVEKFSQPSPPPKPVVELPPIIEPEPVPEPEQTEEPIAWTQIGEHRRASMQDEAPQEASTDLSVAWTSLAEARRSSLKDEMEKNENNTPQTDSSRAWTDMGEARRESLRVEQNESTQQQLNLEQATAIDQATIEAQNAAIAVSMIAAAAAIQSEDELAQASSPINIESDKSSQLIQDLHSPSYDAQSSTQQAPSNQEPVVSEIANVIIEPPPAQEATDDQSVPLAWTAIGEHRRASLREEQLEAANLAATQAAQLLLESSHSCNTTASNAQEGESSQPSKQSDPSVELISSTLNPEAPEFQFNASKETASPWAQTASIEAQPAQPSQASNLDAFDMASFSGEDLLSSEAPPEMMTDEILAAMEQQLAAGADLPSPSDEQLDMPSQSGRSRQVEQQMPGPVFETHLNGSTRSEPEIIIPSVQEPLSEERELIGLQMTDDEKAEQAQESSAIAPDASSESVGSPISDERDKTVGTSSSAAEESSVGLEASATSPDSKLSPSADTVESLPTDPVAGKMDDDDEEVPEGTLAPPFGNTRRAPSPYTGKKNKRKKKKGQAQGQSRFS